MFIEKISDNAIWENSYLICNDPLRRLADGGSRKCAVIDPADKLDKFFEIIEEKQLKLKYILLTHAHLDHVTGVRELAEKFDTKIRMHKEEAEAIKNSGGSMGEYSIRDFLDLPIGYVEDGQVIELGETAIKVIHTPGHTKGSVCYLAGGGHLFSGDTLFKGGIGRTDLYGGDYGEELDSIKKKLLILSDNTVVHSGHGGDTTIGDERANF